MKASKKRKGHADSDYVPPTGETHERRFPSNAVLNENTNFLDQHADYLIDMMSKRTRKTGPAYIARELCALAGLREGAIHGKQISNWYAYRIRSGQIPKTKRKAVTDRNQNVNADNNDCMYCSLNFELFILLTY